MPSTRRVVYPTKAFQGCGSVTKSCRIFIRGIIRKRVSSLSKSVSFSFLERMKHVVIRKRRYIVSPMAGFFIRRISINATKMIMRVIVSPFIKILVVGVFKV